MTIYRDSINEFRDYVFDRDGGYCVYCEYVVVGTFHLDHVLPHSAGGPDVKGNLVLSCIRCNVRKQATFDVVLITKAFFHLLLCGEDMGWIAKSRLHQFEAFASPLYLDIPDYPRSRVPSSIDEPEDAEEIKPRKLNFELVRREFKPTVGKSKEELAAILAEVRKRVADLKSQG